MKVWRMGGLALTGLWVLSWFIPPWQWGLPFLAAVVWTYAGGLVFLIGVLGDGRYRGLWSAGFLTWIGSLQLVWQLLPPIQKPPGTIRIASFNMDAAHYKRAQMEQLAESLRNWHPHVLCLQEVYLGDYTPAAFAQRIGYKYYALLDAKMHMGMLILSDYAIEKSIPHKLLPGTTNGLHEVLLKLPSGKYARILNIHFPSYRLWREESWQWKWLNRVWGYQGQFHLKLRQVLSKREDITWVCGDFNILPFHPTYFKLNQLLYDSHRAAEWGTGPTWLHLLRIDYIWSSLPARSHKIRWLPGQDHAYVEASYRLSGDSITFAQAGR